MGRGKAEIGDGPRFPLKKTIWGLVGVVVATSAIGVWAYFAGYRWISDVLSVAGSGASLVGLLVVFVQVRAVRSVSEAARDAAEAAQRRAIAFICASDIPKAIKLVQEAQTYNRAGKYELSILRLQDLKYSLQQILNNSEIRASVIREAYATYVSDTSVHIGSLEKELTRPSKSFDMGKLNRFLEGVLDALMDLDTRVKQSGEDHGR